MTLRSTPVHGSSARQAHWAIWCMSVALVSLGCTARVTPPNPSNRFIAAPTTKSASANSGGVTTSGTVRLKSGASVRVGSQVSGIVRKLNVTVGTRILRGEVIAQIDPKPLQARLDQQQSEVAIARVAVEKADRDLARVRSLGTSGVLPAQQVEDLVWQVKGAQAKLQKALTDLEAARIELAYTSIRAPISGTVAAVTTQEGETVAAAFAAPTFVTIVDTQSLELVAMVDETDIANIRPGNVVSFSVEAYPSRSFKAVVQRIDPTPLVISGVVNYPVVGLIDSGKDDLRPDMTATIFIATPEAEASHVSSKPNNAAVMSNPVSAANRARTGTARVYDLSSSGL
jgi:HlyD family secretion protein